MVVAPLAIDLGVILACLVALGIILTARYFAEALVNIVRGIAGKIPFVGGLIGKGATWAEQHIVSALDDAVNGTEGVIGAFWHALGNLLTSIGHEIYGLGGALINFADTIYGVVRPWVVHTVIGGIQHGLKWLRHELTSTKTEVFRITKVIEHPVHTKIGGAVRSITKPLTASVTALERWTRTQIAAIDHAIDVVLPRDIAGLRSRAKALEREYSNLWKRVRGLDKITVGALFAGAVAVALGRLGAGWVRCANWRNIGRAVCRTPYGDIEGLLGLLVAGAVIADFRELVKLAQSVEHGVAVGIKDITGA